MLVLVHVQYCGVYDLDRQVIRQMLELKLLEPLERKHRACATKSERLISYYSRTK